MNAPVYPVVTTRTNLDFKLDQLPRYWFGNNPFKTRMLDGVMLSFPDGERYFIQCVRQFRDRVTDPRLKADVAEFIKQEAQHGIAHDYYNKLLEKQGLPVAPLLDFLKKHMAHDLRTKSPELNLAITAACEHVTALMAESMYGHQDTMRDVHPHMRALLAWHSIEEMEHRSVAFDVMDQVAQVDHATRMKAMTLLAPLFLLFSLYRTERLLAGDGFSARERARLFVQNLPWLFGARGILAPMGKPILKWYKKGFHPNDLPVIAQYQVWLDTYARTQDPIAAGEAFWAAGRSD